jgi:hypothetical protein
VHVLGAALPTGWRLERKEEEEEEEHAAMRRPVLRVGRTQEYRTGMNMIRARRSTALSKHLQFCMFI